ncbi:HPr kinase/phosphatase C-terminal domain-containing protein [Sphingobium sp. AP49]|uniref:HPr kinase/phosphorylase n=1 Tax=Sphingobium sp. AP49 TaxID=1144307 RepID=UPI00026ECB6C|nr:HPr kinase/phosphatase C-terminal domain-containing protein [Sphingobium sp. AP49]WHO38166.1 HPr kinase/phosphatase C-terminal domain-containing protein [Sphingobium sp. AP49]
MVRALSSETLHATTVAIGGRSVLLYGASGMGKSDLALRLIDRGAILVSDDYTLLKRVDGRLIATSPATISGRMEVRGIGIIPMPHVSESPVALLVDLADAVERMPMTPTSRAIAGVEVPVIAVVAREASAPIKVELALKALSMR